MITSEDVQAYFSRKEHEVLIIKRLEPWHFRIIPPKVQAIDQSPEAGAFILRARGWTIDGIKRLMNVCPGWCRTNTLVNLGQQKIEAELGVKIEELTT